MAQYFNLTLDTTAPTSGVIGTLSAYYNGAATIGLSADSAAYMKVWTNQTAVGTATDAEVPASWEKYDTSKSVTFANEGTNYVHAMFMDNVGNIGVVVNSNSTIYDTTGPSVTAVEFPARVNQKTAVVKVTASDLKKDIDAVSDIESVTITGADAHVTTQKYTWSDTDRANGYKNCTITLVISDAEEEAKVPVNCSFTVAAKDRAQNVGSSTASKTIVYDNFPASATLTLMDKTCASTLPAYINYYDYGVQITSSDTDVAGYKVWEGSTEPTAWETWTGSPQQIKNLTFSTGEGLKTIHGKIKDTTGNETVLTDVSTTVDTTAPAVTLTSDVTVISEKAGHNSVTFTYGATDTHNMTEYQLLVGSAVLKSGAWTGTKTEVVTEAELIDKSAGAGAKSITLKVKDVAENWGTSSAVTITIDLTAPTGSITANSYYKAGETPFVTVSATDTGGAGMGMMKVWVDSQTAEYKTYAAGNVEFTGLTEGTHTGHVLYKDTVDNESTEYTCSFVVDTVAPVITKVDLDNVIDGHTSYVSHQMTITASDSTSGLAKMRIWGNIGDDIPTEPTTWENWSETKSISLYGADGTKTIYTRVQDTAGNESTVNTYTVVLDRVEPTASITLFKADGVTPQPARTNVTGFVARIASDDATETAGLVYKLSGDLTTPSADWTTYVEDTGKTYMTIAGLNCTSGDGTKQITVTFKDKAGNTKTATGSFILDQTAPVITVQDIDYSIISLQTSERLTEEGVVIADTSCDTMSFKFSANEDLQKYKVCVNEKGQTAEGATPIPETKSTHMQGGAVTANTPVLCKICGVDFKSVVTNDGIYEVIVYGQDVAGTWSAVHAL